MSEGWLVVGLGILGALWPAVDFYRWLGGRQPEDGDIEAWLMQQPLDRVLLYRDLQLGGFGLVFSGFALVALGL